ncbi:GTPase ObgE [candidate division WOR-3 bacterium]|uniref:GTPase Obg n=1 Tax=candidate division WOR-3 bacterium TaxID=2052148 RepID=A0A9D5QEZ8_UNCW3|nr:GTPase ObgE [candidate division WOR-3 bacterium]MBD3365505.1 GTPase ObgE [candidate division WOR-3 bacterium]
MRFVDEVTVRVSAGDGGNGCLSFRREKYVPRGGPDGGDGGDGGSVYLVGNAQLATLADLEYHVAYKAERGGHGKGKNMHGAKGKDKEIVVPLGSDAFDADTGEGLGSVLEHGQKLLVAQGGKGGRGNARFATSTHQAPREHEEGKPGKKRKLKLVLRLIADVGFVGFPNAGKSTLLKALTNAEPKIASYPFTTLSPNLGVLREEWLSFTLSDIPGIIEGAATGKGLGLRFLRHIERTRLLVFVLAANEGPAAAFRTLIKELEAYNPRLGKRKRLIVVNKIDLVTERIQIPGEKDVMYASALTGEGIAQLKERLTSMLDKSEEVLKT